MKEIVIISGKGGTGKTSIAASCAALAAGTAVVADCDVDAADLHLILNPVILHRTEFRSGHRAVIRSQQCTGCGNCFKVCRYDAVKRTIVPHSETKASYSIDPAFCEGCGVCVRFCLAGVIDFPENVCGEWFVSQTRFGTMVHAKLAVAAENSGKLVTLVRTEAKKIAQRQGVEFLIVDGSPGIGCPVIASITAADRVLIVTEPTVSGLHDLERILQLVKQLNIPAMVCVNKWDINPRITEQIETYVHEHAIAIAGRVHYDRIVTRAQQERKTIIEYCSGSDDSCVHEIVSIWKALSTGWHI